MSAATPGENSAKPAPRYAVVIDGRLVAHVYDDIDDAHDDAAASRCEGHKCLVVRLPADPI
jgi:hypothetical protein